MGVSGTGSERRVLVVVPDGRCGTLSLREVREENEFQGVFGRGRCVVFVLFDPGFRDEGVHVVFDSRFRVDLVVVGIPFVRERDGSRDSFGVDGGSMPRVLCAVSFNLSFG